MPSLVWHLTSLNMPSAGTVYEFTFPPNTERYSLQVIANRGLSNASLADFTISTYSEGFAHGNYWTCPAGMNYWESDIRTPSDQRSPLSIYIRSTTPNVVAEIFIWKSN